ncbi:hypothetical protein AB0D66_21670 [Streptomyces sp. NPDC048270]|uniref:hypothetical protein n=1 Tax=Streptomyces sp. NPDC048270 TaxID=3154615 RepID=UPI00340CF171
MPPLIHQLPGGRIQDAFGNQTQPWPVRPAVLTAASVTLLEPALVALTLVGMPLSAPGTKSFGSAAAGDLSQLLFVQFEASVAGKVAGQVEQVIGLLD